MWKRIAEQIALTTTERKVILFLVITLLAGAGIRLYQEVVPSAPKFDYHASDSTFTALSSAADDSTAHSDAAVVDGKLNINTATKEQLMELPGIGEKTAVRIIERRNEIGKFTSLEELKTIKGITKKRFEQLQSLIVAE
ncbi:MAG TPA: helix-hairpin-helix domain-containing protein [Bacteroidota bacterium]|nr:helix-hairpin-helix domain-containing protein [Bacteroidota bacterium]